MSKKNMKDRIYDWVKENHNEYVRKDLIQQTNITFRLNVTNREAYYFQCCDWNSPYTMKRWLEIAEGKLYDTWKHNQGTWYWIKNNHIIN